DVALAVEPHLMRRVQLRFVCRSTVTGITARPGARDDRNLHAGQIEPKNPVASEFGPIERTVRTDDEPERIIQHGSVCKVAIRSRAHHARSCDGSDSLRRALQPEGRCRRDQESTGLEELPPCWIAPPAHMRLLM